MVLKRKFSMFIVFVLAIFAAIGLTSCGNSTNATQGDKYTQTERNFINSLDLTFMDSLKDPSSLKITRILNTYCDGKIVAFSCTANNSFGASVTSNHIIITKSFELNESMISDGFMELDHVQKLIGTLLLTGVYYDYKLATDAMITTTDFSKALQMIVYYNSELNKDSTFDITVANVNKLLDEYKKSQGWA